MSIRLNGKIIAGSSKSTYTGLEICDIGMALYVDETKGLRRYLNGQIVDINANTQAFLNRLKQITTLHPSLLCTEEEWQTAKTMSAFGQVGKFVFNYSGDEIVSVRLPRVVNVQGLFDLQNLGMTVSESLPNIKGTFSADDSSGNVVATGSINVGTARKGGYSTNTNQTQNRIYSLNASRSSSTYQDNAPVQQEAIQYPYFIQIATGSETENNIINEIELNNPYSLFDSKYSDHELNNLSWLKSSGQWNAKDVYPTAYDKLLKVYNGTETVEGLSVKLLTEDYTDYDFVLNTADETFRLPLKTLHTDNTVDSLSLFFYVGETVQNVNLIDAGRIGEQLANKVDLDAQNLSSSGKSLISGLGMPSSKYIDLTLGASGTTYIAPANGWFSLNVETKATNKYIMMSVGDRKVFHWSGSTLIECGLIMPVRQGQIMALDYNCDPYVADFNSGLRFYYAEGEI